MPKRKATDDASQETTGLQKAGRTSASVARAVAVPRAAKDAAVAELGAAAVAAVADPRAAAAPAVAEPAAAAAAPAVAEAAAVDDPGAAAAPAVAEPAAAAAAAPAVAEAAAVDYPGAAAAPAVSEPDAAAAAPAVAEPDFAAAFAAAPAVAEPGAGEEDKGIIAQLESDLDFSMVEEDAVMETQLALTSVATPLIVADESSNTQLVLASEAAALANVHSLEASCDATRSLLCRPGLFFQRQFSITIGCHGARVVPAPVSCFACWTEVLGDIHRKPSIARQGPPGINEEYYDMARISLREVLDVYAQFNVDPEHTLTV
jgi:hypothetical protein